MMRELLERRNMTFEEAAGFFNELSTQSDIRKSALLTALQAKGVTGTELAGMAHAMRGAAKAVDIPGAADTCGTGGDGSSSINVSTAGALLLSCFTTVAKHGNGSVTSRSGSSTVMQELGIGMPQTPEDAERGAKLCNFAYLHAPLYHPAMEGIMPVRRELGFPTVFNILGPLANPAKPETQLVGISNPHLVVPVAEALSELGARRAIVVHGGGLDEVHPGSRTQCALVEGSDLFAFDVYPSDFGVPPGRVLPCNSAKESAERIMQALAGRGNPDDTTFIVLNAAMALFATGYGDLPECKDAITDILGEEALAQVEAIRDAYATL
jgi:anthranilate phosphoribosyltransferase